MASWNKERIRKIFFLHCLIIVFTCCWSIFDTWRYKKQTFRLGSYVNQHRHWDQKRKRKAHYVHRNVQLQSLIKLHAFSSRHLGKISVKSFLKNYPRYILCYCLCLERSEFWWCARHTAQAGILIQATSHTWPGIPAYPKPHVDKILNCCYKFRNMTVLIWNVWNKPRIFFDDFHETNSRWISLFVYDSSRLHWPMHGF